MDGAAADFGRMVGVEWVTEFWTGWRLGAARGSPQAVWFGVVVIGAIGAMAAAASWARFGCRL